MNVAKTLPSGHVLEQTTVRVELYDAERKACIVCVCAVDHYGTEAVHVHFPPDWRRLVSLVGLDAYHECTEGWLWTEALRAFQRSGR